MATFMVPFIVCAVLLTITAALFIAYVYAYRKHWSHMEQTLRESPVILESLPKLQALYEPSNKEPLLAGLIVETRDHHNLVPVIRTVRERLPEIHVYVFHGQSNEQSLKDAFGGDTKVSLLRIESDNLTIRQYNYILTRPELWSNLNAQNILVFQTDSVIFSNSKVNIYDYIEYDYVGAPWSNISEGQFSDMVRFIKMRTGAHVGNGGLSLRRRKKMLEAVSTYPYITSPHLNEDVYFNWALRELPNAKMPTVQISAQLFYETVDADELPFGAHRFVPEKHADKILSTERHILESYRSPAH